MDFLRNLPSLSKLCEVIIIITAYSFVVSYIYINYLLSEIFLDINFIDNIPISIDDYICAFRFIIIFVIGVILYLHLIGNYFISKFYNKLYYYDILFIKHKYLKFCFILANTILFFIAYLYFEYKNFYFRNTYLSVAIIIFLQVFLNYREINKYIFILIFLLSLAIPIDIARYNINHIYKQKNINTIYLYDNEKIQCTIIYNFKYGALILKNNELIFIYHSNIKRVKYYNTIDYKIDKSEDSFSHFIKRKFFYNYKLFLDITNFY